MQCGSSVVWGTKYGAVRRVHGRGEGGGGGGGGGGAKSGEVWLSLEAVYNYTCSF